MKKIMIGVIGLFLISLCAVGVLGKTLVAGNIYNSDYSNTVVGAKVSVSCEHNTKKTIINTTSLSGGTYNVVFREMPMECTYNDLVNVTAFHPDYGIGNQQGIVNIAKNVSGLDVNIAIINVSIPEFTTIAAGIALTGALLGVFVFRKREDE